jgi:hypothetical protein
MIPTPSATGQASAVRWSGRAVGEPLHVIVDELYRRVACYVVAEMGDGQAAYMHPAGTAFFISVSIGPGVVSYAVTARHVIEDTHRNRDCRKMFLRGNTKAGRYEDVPVEYEDWVFHPETDIAVCRVSWSVINFFEASRMEVLGGEDSVEPGQNVFLVGLFGRFPGEDKINALVRFGKVALHKCPIPIKQTGRGDSLIDAYLIEATTWGGESGAPVFLHDEYNLQQDFSDAIRALRRGDIEAAINHLEFRSVERTQVRSSQVRPSLLGMLHGHFEVQMDVTASGQPTGSEVSLTSGIAVVIPAEKIKETLMDARLVAEREQIRLEMIRRSTKPPKPGAI